MKLKNGSWNGLVGMVLRGDVHLGNSSFIYTGQRLEAVDYLIPISTLRFKFSFSSVSERKYIQTNKLSKLTKKQSRRHRICIDAYNTHVYKMAQSQLTNSVFACFA
jgi:hypothetical protein